MVGYTPYCCFARANWKDVYAQKARTARLIKITQAARIITMRRDTVFTPHLLLIWVNRIHVSLIVALLD